MNEIQVMWGIFAFVGVLFIIFIVSAVRQSRRTTDWGKQKKDPLNKLKGGIK